MTLDSAPSNKDAVLKYLKTLVYSIERGDLEVGHTTIRQGSPEFDSDAYEIHLDLNVKGFVMPLYELLTDKARERNDGQFQCD